MGPTETTGRASEQPTAAPGNLNLDYLARTLAGLDPDSRVAVLRRTEQITHADRLATRQEYENEKASMGFGVGASGPGQRPREVFSIENIEDVFTYRGWDPWQQDQGNQVRDALVSTAKVFLRVVPASPLRTRALNKLFDARMIANAAITHGGRF